MKRGHLVRLMVMFFAVSIGWASLASDANARCRKLFNRNRCCKPACCQPVCCETRCCDGTAPSGEGGAPAAPEAPSAPDEA